MTTWNTKLIRYFKKRWLTESSVRKWEMMWSIRHEHGTKKKFVSPDSNWTYDHPFTASDALTTELRRTRGELGHIQGSCMTCVHPTARISTKSSCVWYITKDGKFKAQFLSGTEIFFLCLMLVTCWSHHFSKRFVKTSETRDLSKTRSTKKPLRSQHNRTKENNT